MMERRKTSCGCSLFIGLLAGWLADLVVDGVVRVATLVVGKLCGGGISGVGVVGNGDDKGAW